MALTSESVAALANAGLVKRAERELAAGKRPQLAEDAAGVVTGTFEDGVITRLQPGTSLRDTPCSCGAQTVCRHRVAVALAYRAWVSASAPADLDAGGGAPADAAAAPSAGAEAAGSPGEVGDDALLGRIGKRAFDGSRLTVALLPFGVSGARGEQKTQSQCVNAHVAPPRGP